MKKFYAFMIMAAALAACTRAEQPQNETPNQPEVPATYTLTLEASKGKDTRALVLNDNTLNAIWDGTEQVFVYLNGNQIATLTPDQSGQATCLLRGEFTQPPVAGNVLTLKLNSDNYMGQRGTLAYIGANCDYAIATVTVTGVNDGKIASQEGGAKFENQQAIVKFTLMDKTAGTTISPSALTVKGNGTEVATVTGIDAATYTANGDGVLFVAIPATSGTIDLAATVGSDTYKYSRENVTFTVGEYYSITVKMIKKTSRIVDLSDVNWYAGGLFTAQDGDVLTGTLNDQYGRRVHIADGATVTLRNVNITKTYTQHPGVALDGSATIILEGDNTIHSLSNHAGISGGGPGTTLTIKGGGTLEASADYTGAGIGSNGSTSGADAISCGNIVILGGTIKATSIRGAGIGCGSAVLGGSVSCGNITISAPAKVTATKGSDAPYSIGPSSSGQCGTVTIYDHVYWDESAGIQDATLSTSPLVIPLP